MVFCKSKGGIGKMRKGFISFGIIVLILITFGVLIFVLPNLEVELLGSKFRPFSFLFDWEFSGHMVNLFSLSIYFVVFGLFVFLHYRVFAFANNFGWFDSFYKDVLSLSPKTIKSIDNFTKREKKAEKIVIRGLRRQTKKEVKALKKEIKSSKKRRKATDEEGVLF